MSQVCLLLTSGIGSVVPILYSGLFFATCDLRKKSEKWKDVRESVSEAATPRTAELTNEQLAGQLVAGGLASSPQQ
jgi:hypothetical protein